MKKLWMAIAVTIAVSLLATACSLDKHGQGNIGALVNGEPITIEDLHIRIEQREIDIEVQKRFSQQYSKSTVEIPEELRADFEQFLMDINVTHTDLSEDQETFLKSHYIFFNGVRGSTDSITGDDLSYIKRTYNHFVFTPDESQTLSHLIKNLVLYQEAVKQGHIVPEAEAREMYKRTYTMPQESQETELPDEYLKYLEHLKIEEEVILEHGYRSREEYLDQQFPDYFRSISIINLKDRFREQWMVQYPNFHGFERHVKAENAWYDYTENLVRQADIEIMLEGFEMFD